MLRKQNNRRSAFTLVEVMIVVVIIGLLATLALPNFLRARKRSQATTILQDLRQLDAAKNQYALETNKKGTNAPEWADLKGYIKENSPLYARAGKDIFNQAYVIGAVDAPVTAVAGTYDEFDDVIKDTNFWGGFYTE